MHITSNEYGELLPKHVRDVLPTPEQLETELKMVGGEVKA